MRTTLRDIMADLHTNDALLLCLSAEPQTISAVLEVWHKRREYKSAMTARVAASRLATLVRRGLAFADEEWPRRYALSAAGEERINKIYEDYTR